MPTPVDMGARLLRGAAAFFRHVGQQNVELNDEMLENAEVCEKIADLLEEDPMREISEEETF